MFAIGLEDRSHRSSREAVRWLMKPLALVVFLSLGLGVLNPSCKAVKGADGTITITFAPDMTITAFGLEAMVKSLGELWGQCLAGAWDRPCTPKEISEIKDSIDKINDLKGKQLRPEVQAGPSATL